VTGLDTNVLLRYLVRDEPPPTARATRELERDERFLIGNVVLCELAWVLDAGYGVSRAEIGAALTVTFDRGAARPRRIPPPVMAKAPAKSTRRKLRRVREQGVRADNADGAGHDRRRGMAL